jgi:thiosulfate dehydrogenase
MKIKWWPQVVCSLVLSGVLSALLAESPRGPSDTTNAPQPPRELPPGELGKVVQLGREIVERTNTHPLSKAYVGNDLTCSSCHLDAGTHPKAASFLGVATAYPAWSPREERVITLEDRSLNCFMRSMNGVRPPLGSEVSVAITAYITWLSSEMPVRMNAKKPLGPLAVKPLAIDVAEANLDRGQKIYQRQCADCHGDDGAGGDDGPPVWGERSFNQGAGLSQNDKLAAWLKVAMPLDEPNLSEQEALDVAAFINSQSRRKFVLKDHLPPTDRLGEFNQQPSNSD